MSSVSRLETSIEEEEPNRKLVNAKSIPLINLMKLDAVNDDSQLLSLRSKNKDVDISQPT